MAQACERPGAAERLVRALDDPHFPLSKNTAPQPRGPLLRYWTAVQAPKDGPLARVIGFRPRSFPQTSQLKPWGVGVEADGHG